VQGKSNLLRRMGETGRAAQTGAPGPVGEGQKTILSAAVNRAPGMDLN